MQATITDTSHINQEEYYKRLEQSASFRLLDRLISTAYGYPFLLRCYAYHQFLDAIDPDNAIHSATLKKILLDKICLDAWILLGDEKSETHYFKLVVNNGNNRHRNSSISDQVISYAHTIVGDNFDNDKDLLRACVLSLADVTKDDFLKAQEDLKDYRNKAVGHLDDALHHTSLKQVFCPNDLLIWAKLADAAYKLLQHITYVKEDDKDSGVAEKEFNIGLVTYPNRLAPFEDGISSHQDDFRKVVLNLADLILYGYLP